MSLKLLSGKYTLSVELFGIKILSKTGDFCKLSANFTCPHNAGAAVFQLKEAIPSESPTGTLTIQLSAVDQNDKQLFCIGLKVDVVSSGEFYLVEPEPFKVSEKCSDNMPVMCNVLPKCEVGLVAARYHGCYRCVEPEFCSVPLPNALVTSGHPIDFKSCATGATKASVSSVSVSPYPLKKGNTLLVNALGNLTETLTSGTYTLSVELFGISILTKTGDICTLSKTFQCPHNAGAIALQISEDIPSESPSGTFNVKLSAKDQNQNALFCVALAVTVS